MALSADGNTALIGGPDDSNLQRRSVGVHTLRGHLDAAGRADRQRQERAGRVRVHVALSADGNTALIGGP